MASGYAGVQNPLFFLENTHMLFGDAKDSIGQLVADL
jgi:NAD(P) transhydrogenase subunit beta